MATPGFTNFLRRWKTRSCGPFLCRTPTPVPRWARSPISTGGERALKPPRGFSPVAQRQINERGVKFLPFHGFLRKRLSGLAFRRRYINGLKMTDSQKLVTEYVRTGSEPAFRELVARYLDLVYGS